MLYSYPELTSVSIMGCNKTGRIDYPVSVAPIKPPFSHHSGQGLSNHTVVLGKETTVAQSVDQPNIPITSVTGLELQGRVRMSSRD